MGLLDTDIVEDLLHSSSISKGIERTMERMINDLEIDSMYIIRYDSTVARPEVEFDWDNRSVKRDIDLTEHLKKLGSNIIVYDPFQPEISEPDLKTALEKADVISMHASGKEEILTLETFAWMKDRVVILNCASFFFLASLNIPNISVRRLLNPFEVRSYS